MITAGQASAATEEDVWTLTGSTQRSLPPQTIEIRKTPFRIGRRPDLDLSLNSEVVSGEHAELLESAGILLIRDLGSTNGTFVNGEQISSDTLLSEGDWIDLGDLRLSVNRRHTPRPNDAAYSNLETRFFDVRSQSEARRGLLELMSSRALEAYFQPIHRLSDGEVHGYEFLAQSKVKGVNEPGKMFMAAEAEGREVDLSMLCREMGVKHSTRLPHSRPLFLNTHPNEPLMDAVVPQMRELREVDLERPLVLEIHERAITEPDLVRDLRAALSDFDVRLAFDDLGAGQARIRELISAPSDYIKFDAALIRDLQDVSEDQRDLFRSIVQGVRKEGAITVAEGVETQDIVAMCKEVGFDLVQGYAMSRPTIIPPGAGSSAEPVV